MSCTRQHRLDHLRLKKKLLDKKKGMLQFPYEAFVDEKTNLRQHKQAKLLSLIMEYVGPCKQLVENRNRNYYIMGNPHVNNI